MVFGARATLELPRGGRGRTVASHPRTPRSPGAPPTSRRIGWWQSDARGGGCGAGRTPPPRMSVAAIVPRPSARRGLSPAPARPWPSALQYAHGTDSGRRTSTGVPDSSGISSSLPLPAGARRRSRAPVDRSHDPPVNGGSHPDVSPEPSPLHGDVPAVGADGKVTVAGGDLASQVRSRFHRLHSTPVEEERAGGRGLAPRSIRRRRAHFPRRPRRSDSGLAPDVTRRVPSCRPRRRPRCPRPGGRRRSDPSGENAGENVRRLAGGERARLFRGGRRPAGEP